MDFYMEYFEERVILKIKKLFANNKTQGSNTSKPKENKITK